MIQITVFTNDGTIRMALVETLEQAIRATHIADFRFHDDVDHLQIGGRDGDIDDESLAEMAEEIATGEYVLFDIEEFGEMDEVAEGVTKIVFSLND